MDKTPDTHGGFAYGMPRNLLVAPLATPVKVAWSSLTVGAPVVAGAANERTARVARAKDGMRTSKRILGA